ncbi:hypothetical protein HanRHA438_Chr17g0809441 [Helianthus annuus]|nr:hypothetical protein HanIR_Chr17g0866881 [Helianthus annuus]KAJ0447263.1 hypothetical protein HanHA89_Chr17g0703371 [Helianthus annuus]KAJ0632173.1 hypothetical protein HanLR1_Chr17g0662091 [Helianthus annuus]KAJ0636043.1 hypothetical protein HanOQP8_Chr17g0657471 [Helianthus annuus]KAJ0826009.1 hypothetical protein HanRHA438_Chr17g0809441 [Helianthus annuus]
MIKHKCSWHQTCTCFGWIYITKDSSLHFFSPTLRNKFIFKDFTYGVMAMDVCFGSVIVSAQLPTPFD